MSDVMVLVINTGSSSIKMALVDMPSETLLAEAVAERLGEQEAGVSWQFAGEMLHVDIAGA